jgi:hypothetical protein
MECEACGFDTMYGHELEGCEVARQEAAERGFDGGYASEPMSFGVGCQAPQWCECMYCDEADAMAIRCKHDLDEAQCVTCTGKRDDFASYRRKLPTGTVNGKSVPITHTENGPTVGPYAQLSTTVRGGFSIGQVRDVVPSVETATRQWTDAPCDTEWASGADPDAPVYVQPKAKRGDTIPLWYRVTVRGATAPWPDPDAYDRGKYFAEIAAYCNDKEEPPGPVEALIP